MNGPGRVEKETILDELCPNDGLAPNHGRKALGQVLGRRSYARVDRRSQIWAGRRGQSVVPLGGTGGAYG